MTTTPIDPAIAHRPAAARVLAPARPRIAALDIIRGAVMVLMAIDHVRVYSGQPAGGPTAGIFFTRWITNFCAPAFVFLAGTSIFLHQARSPDRLRLSRFLLTRGAWLVLLELTFLRVSWTFNFDYAHYLLAGVIWMIGWCFILMAGLVWLPFGAIFGFGVAVVGLHNLTDVVGGSPSGWLWQLLYAGGPITLGGANGPTLAVLYSIVPWIGVMALGYTFGTVIRRSPAERRRLCFTIGLGAIALFLVLRTLDGYGDPRPWHGSKLPGLFAWLNPSKYPASLDFLLLTLGPAIAIVPLLERATGALARLLGTFGRVPLFFYLLHIPLIHALALLVAAVRDHGGVDWLFQNHPMMAPPAPQGYVWPLPLLYGIFAVAVIALYFPCRWFANLKASRGDAWLGYL
jgi:uncharacterized membrane protein